jgi:O-antigen/teichoic acid export membrane protein
MPGNLTDEQAVPFGSGAPKAEPLGGRLPTVTSPPTRNRLAAILAKNVAVSIARLLIASLVAIVLPAYLTKKLPPNTYSAWVLILQVSGYVAYLDFGVQNGISKYVSEYEARGDFEGASLRASAGLVMMTLLGILGSLMTLVLAWQAPNLFHEMPVSLYSEVQISLIFVGLSLSFNLFCSAFAAVFLGLQQYAIPMAISILNRLLFAGAVCGALFFHRGLIAMGAAVALVNVTTGLLQLIAWRKLAGHIRLSLFRANRPILRKMISYCSVLAIWSVGMLCINGLDVTIVGRYDYGKTGYFSIAGLPINFMIAIIGAALGPLLPSVSALSTVRTPKEMGNILSTATRYIAIMLIGSSIPLLVFGYPLLKVWVGPDYASHTIVYLRILVIANIVRMLGAPYATMLVATDQQKVGIASAVVEAAINVASSIYLVRQLGAVGVAYGTLLGSFCGVGMHFVVSMHYTRATFVISRLGFFLRSMVLPFIAAVPTLLILPIWWSSSAPHLPLLIWVAWGGSTFALVWWKVLKSKERVDLINVSLRRKRPA